MFLAVSVYQGKQLYFYNILKAHLLLFSKCLYFDKLRKGIQHLICFAEIEYKKKVLSRRQQFSYFLLNPIWNWDQQYRSGGVNSRFIQSRTEWPTVCTSFLGWIDFLHPILSVISSKSCFFEIDLS